MLPVIAIVGRPNVGKSTLFNYLTRTRDALVADEPGVTRDRQYGHLARAARDCLVIDTGGLSDEAAGIDPLIVDQAELALEEADVILFLVDGRAGPNSRDEAIGRRLRLSDKPVFLAVNKTEGLQDEMAVSEFYALGLSEPVAISSAHGKGISHLVKLMEQALPEAGADAEEQAGIRVALVGRPNVGKSTLVNRLVGEDRVVAFDKPGTTRDSIAVPLERDGKPYVLIDTAGVRRRSRVEQGVEKFSVIKTLQAIEYSQVVLLVLDAHEGITDQDAHLLGHIHQSGRALVIAVNKWDGLDEHSRNRIKDELDRKFSFISYADVHTISALHGTGVGHLFKSVDRAYQAAMVDMSTSRLTQILEDAIMAHAPPMIRGRRIKLRYAHQGGSNPPRVVIHGNQTGDVPEDYRRYLAACFRDALKLRGTPVRIELRTGKNPYQGRKNKLTPRQLKQRQRMMKHVKGKRR